jgi:hypothetical protein
MTRGELMRRITARELMFWQAYEIEFGPIGQSRDDLLTGWLSMFTIAPHRGEDAGPLRLNDYLPRLGRAPVGEPDEDEDEQKEVG